ncbi:MAG TPA: PRC-barrel domain-containing protein [Chloroflexota bacterium]|nr:PRC-barrel domain-containing protein [Chloroflexota bacterium]
MAEEKALDAIADTVVRRAVEGLRVVTESGTEIGTVADIDADFSTGDVRGYVLAGGLVDRLQHREKVVPTSTVKNIGDWTIVVADEVVPA